MEWVNYSHIIGENNMVLPTLCALLEEENFQLHAAECLCQIVSRKGPMEERKYLLEWFDIRAMGFILTAANNVSGKSLNENNYLFLKKLTQVGINKHFFFFFFLQF